MPSLVSKEGVTTIPKGSRIAIGTQSEAVRLKIYFEYEIVYSPNKYRETEGIKECQQNGFVNGIHPKRLSRFCEAELYDKSNVRCISDCAVNVRELYQRCESKKTTGNGGMRCSC